MNTKKIFILVFTYIYIIGSAQTNGGMWIPTELPEKSMKKAGMKVKSFQLFNTEKPSIEDAIVEFDGGCTAEIISPKGLLLTNHHCGFEQIQAHSAVENDYIKNGFWSKNEQEELPNEGLEVTFVTNIKNITNEMLQGISDNANSTERNEILKQNAAKIQANYTQTDFIKTYIVPFYTGNKFYLFETKTFKDVRLVAAPPSCIGNYGMDTDNWVWPRHTGDFSMFRIYADKNNQPTTYSKENIPYKPEYFLPISIKGIKENQFTMVYGFPGRTNEYLTAAALNQTLKIINPTAIKLRDANLSNLKEKMQQDDATRIKYASKYARIANGWKKWSGESQGLKISSAVEKREQYEREFLQRVNANPSLSKYKNIISDLNSLYQQIEKFQLSETLYNETFKVNSETFNIALQLNSLIKSFESNKDYEKNKKTILERIKGMMKDYDAELDLKSSQKVLEYYTKDIPSEIKPSALESTNLEEIWKKSIITNEFFSQENNYQLQDNQLIETLKNDLLIQFVAQIQKNHSEKVTPNFTSLKAKIDDLQRQYMNAQLEVFQDKIFFPDANSTLRITYGNVKGYSPKDALNYDYKTNFDGYMEKYIPNDYEFDVLPEVRKLYESKDYGKYAENGTLPLNFIATNHTTGGNSGSPALDANGNLIGLNFDRVWEGTMSDLNYDPKICRNIMVDARYILWVIEKVGKSQRLINEMKIVK